MINVITVLVLCLCMCSEASSWSWMVVSGVGNSTPSAVDSRRPPPCPSYCLNALGGNVTARTPVGLWWCQGTRFNSEKWDLGEPSGGLYVTNADTGKPYCLDVAPTAPFGSSSNGSIDSTSIIDGMTPVQPAAPDGERQYYYLTVAECLAGAASQRWWLEPGSGRLRGHEPGVPGGGVVTYVRAYRPANQSTYYLLLSADAGSAVSFTQVDGPAALASFYAAPPSSPDHPNAILNGNLQFLTGYQPLPFPGLDPTPLPRPQLLPGYMFILCHWSVEDEVSIGSCNAPAAVDTSCLLPPDWCPSRQNVVFLNCLPRPPPARPGRIVQTVPTLPGARYLLVFEMKNPYHFTQLVQLSLAPPPPDRSPASVRFGVASNQTGSVWHEFQFTAPDYFVNVSFISDDATDCGPLIDNIQMYALPDDANQSRPPPQIPRGRRFGQLVTLVAVGWTLAVVLTALLLMAECRMMKTRKAAAAALKEIEQPIKPQILLLSYEQLREYTQDFKVLIGVGGFGKVYYGEMPDGQKIAVKRGSSLATGRGAIVGGDDHDESVDFRGEVELLSRIHHRYIVKFLGYCDDKGERMLVFEYLPNKSLYNHLHDVRHNNEECMTSLSWGVRMRIAYQVAYALEYLHYGASPPVLHRDVKSANVLLTGTLEARVADMGISKVRRVEDATQWTSTMTVVKGSRGYLDPHYLQTNMTSEKSDVYSFGVLLLELVSGRKAITHDSQLLTSWARDVYYNNTTYHIITCDHDHLRHPHNHQQQAAITIDSHNYQPAPAKCYIFDDDAASAVLDPRLRGSLPPSFVHAAMELARFCLHEQPRLRPSMMEVTRRLRDTQLQFLAADADVDEGASHADNVIADVNDIDDDDGFLTPHSSTSDGGSFQSIVSGR